MTDKLTVNRRRLLELTGVGTTVAVAGCSGQLDGDGDGRQVALSLQPDQEELQSRQQELQQEVLSGNTTQEEAQEEIQALQEEATADAIETAEETFGELGLTIEDRIEAQGLLLVSGSDGDILDSLDEDIVGALAAGSTFEQLQEQQEAQQEQQEALAEAQSTENESDSE